MPEATAQSRKTTTNSYICRSEKMTLSISNLSSTTTLLILAATAILLPIISCTELQQSPLNRTRRQQDDVPNCRRAMEDVPVSYEGCEPTTMKVKVCRGYCDSITLHTVKKPYKTRLCHCCKPVHYKHPGFQRIWFTCGPDRTLKQKKVFFPKVRECGCKSCP